MPMTHPIIVEKLKYDDAQIQHAIDQLRNEQIQNAIEEIRGKKNSLWNRLRRDTGDNSESGCFGSVLWIVAVFLGLGIVIGYYVLTGRPDPMAPEAGNPWFDWMSKRAALMVLVGAVIVCRLVLGLGTWPLVRWFQRSKDKAALVVRLWGGAFLFFVAIGFTLLFVANVIKAQGHLRSAEDLSLIAGLILGMVAGPIGLVVFCLWLKKLAGIFRKEDDPETRKKTRRAALELGLFLFLGPIVVVSVAFGVFKLFGGGP